VSFRTNNPLSAAGDLTTTVQLREDMYYGHTFEMHVAWIGPSVLNTSGENPAHELIIVPTWIHTQPRRDHWLPGFAVPAPFLYAVRMTSSAESPYSPCACAGVQRRASELPKSRVVATDDRDADNRRHPLHKASGSVRPRAAIYPCRFDFHKAVTGTHLARRDGADFVGAGRTFGQSGPAAGVPGARKLCGKPWVNAGRPDPAR
jgi:hypothetical protein